jgi:hypothetical protein
MGALFKYRLDLPTLVQLPVPDVLSHIIYEADRLNPTLPVRMRYCETDTNLSGNAEVKKGEWVAPLIRAANMDPRVFGEPFRFKLDRDIKTYLLFNEADSSRVCWGRDRVAMIVLQECVKAQAVCRDCAGSPARAAACEHQHYDRVAGALHPGYPGRSQATTRDMARRRRQTEHNRTLLGKI